MFELILFQRAFLACIIIGFANGYTSAFVLMNRSPLKLAALSHSLLPGIVLAIMFAGLTVITAFIGATFMAVFTGVLSLLFARNSRLSQDTTLSVFYTGAFALGILLLKQTGHIEELEHWLFGNILGLTDMDLWMSFGAGLLSVGLISLFKRPLILTLFEPNVAQTLGVPVRLVQYTSFIILIMVLVTTLQAVGCILAIGLIVTPGAAVRLFTDSPNKLFLYSGLLGAIGSSLGLYLSYSFNYPAASSIVITLTLFFLLSFVIRAGLTLLQKKA